MEHSWPWRIRAPKLLCGIFLLKEFALPGMQATVEPLLLHLARMGLNWPQSRKLGRSKSGIPKPESAVPNSRAETAPLAPLKLRSFSAPMDKLLLGVTSAEIFA